MPHWELIIVAVVVFNLVVFWSRFHSEQSFWSALHSGRALMVQAASMTVILALNILSGWSRYELANNELRSKIPGKILAEIDQWLRPPLSLVESFALLGLGAIIIVVFVLSGYTDRYFNEEMGNPPYPRKWANTAKNLPSFQYLVWTIFCLLLGAVSMLAVFYFNARAENVTLGVFFFSAALPTLGALLFLGMVLAVIVWLKYGTLGVIHKWDRRIPKMGD